ncbi:hypothetical protein D917_00969 [Trichinella nativa]|uniref:EF-hand domain-containing protein n=1 Tax=Trichinella nativa TaxID=6335 RepID=A0A1Y3EWU3_9BILA|nr:hypothetical protein D917_00969 [Trichinella nativa]
MDADVDKVITLSEFCKAYTLLTVATLEPNCWKKPIARDYYCYYFVHSFVSDWLPENVLFAILLAAKGQK